MSRERSYSPQIDALRAIAIIVVMMHHYIIGPFLLAGFGVVMFFVLSGYFATEALLRFRDERERGAVSFRIALTRFYQRRYLRMLPLHFLVLGAAALFGVEYAREMGLWNAFFLSNFAIMLHGEWDGRFSPLWSLGVLEQFYLVWPVAILMLPRRSLLPLCGLGVMAAVVWRIVCMREFFSPISWTVMPLNSLDQLCIGAMLALCSRSNLPSLSRWFSLAGSCGGILFCWVLLLRTSGFETPGSAYYLPIIASLAFTRVVDLARTGFGGRTGYFLSLPLLCYAGRISFQAFLLHNFTEFLLPHTPAVRHIMATNYRFLLLVPATFLLAEAAWRFFEAPIIMLRHSNISLWQMWDDPVPVAEAFSEPILNLVGGAHTGIRSLAVCFAMAVPDLRARTSGWLGMSNAGWASGTPFNLEMMEGRMCHSLYMAPEMLRYSPGF